jgi:putative Holliday junction resolvase
MRAVGVDLGERRIGIALSDSGGVLVTPYGVVQRSGDPAQDRRALAEIVAEVGAEVVVVGLPLSLSGASGRAAEAASAEARSLAAILSVPVETFDERLTTVEAARRRRERAAASVPGRRRSAPRGAAARDGIDAEAAAVMLEAWLAARRGADR